MNEALETHFIFIDNTKNVLFNATTEEQEEQARHLLDLAAEQEKALYIEQSMEEENYNHIPILY